MKNRVGWIPPHLPSGLWIRNRLLRIIVQARDALLPDVSRKDPLNWEVVSRVVFCVGGHLGDCVNALYVIAGYKHLHPKASISVVCPRWMKGLLADCTYVDNFVIRTPWAHDRSPASRWIKISLASWEFLSAIWKLRRIRPDAAIDLYWHWPNSAMLLWFGGVGFRAGYTSGGAGKLYNYRLPWRHSGQHVVEYMAALLGERGAAVLAARVPLWATSHDSTLSDAVRSRLTKETRLIVVQPGAGDPRKHWSEEGWRSVLQWCESKAIVAVLIGHGSAEVALCERLARVGGSIVNLAGTLSIAGVRALMAHADAFVGLDSVGGHLAGAYDVPTVVLFTGITKWCYWRPFRGRSALVTANTPCAPCFRSNGCLPMECVRTIPSEAVTSAISNVIGTVAPKNAVH